MNTSALNGVLTGGELLHPLSLATPLTDVKKMESYLRMKVDQRDWHAVWDAAIDIAILEARSK